MPNSLMPPAEPNSAENVVGRSKDLLLRLVDRLEAPEQVSTPHLGYGSVINAIVLCEAGALRGEEQDVRMAAEQLRHGMRLLEQMPLSSSLYRGITGFGWALQTFPRPELLPEREETLTDLDELLADGVEVTNNPNIDIINGLAGIMVYALARGDSEPSSQMLWSVLDQVYSAFFTAWSPGPHHSPKSAANNLGVAHGVPGLLAVGAVARSRGLFSAQTGELLARGFDTLWTNAVLKDGHYTYPTSYGMPNTSRLAWCYGALGIAATFKLGIALDPQNRERLRRMTESSLAQYWAGTHGIRDATLCHGYAGAALSFEYLAQGGFLDDDLVAALRKASLHAATLTLNDERRELGDCVFEHWTKDGMRQTMAFLEGGTGVALALTAAYAGAPRPWMQLLGYY